MMWPCCGSGGGGGGSQTPWTQNVDADGFSLIGANDVFADVLISNQPVLAPAPYDLVCSLGGKPGAGAIVLQYVAVRALQFDSDLTGAYGFAGTNPTASATYTIAKNGSTVGTVAISTSGVFVFSTTGHAVINLNPGDRLTITAPGSQDSTLANVSFTLPGMR